MLYGAERYDTHTHTPPHPSHPVIGKVLDKDVLAARQRLVTSAQLKSCFACNSMQKESCSKSKSAYACQSPTRFAGCDLGKTYADSKPGQKF